MCRITHVGLREALRFRMSTGARTSTGKLGAQSKLARLKGVENVRDGEHAPDGGAKKNRKPGRIHQGEVGIGIEAGLDNTASARAGTTGREVLCDQQYASIRAWAELPTREKLLSHPLVERFRQLIREANVVEDELLTCFRGRFIRQGYPHSAKNMGPPCKEQARSGRYNKEHDPVLYLCDSTAGVECELRHRKACGKLYCQEYLIPGGSIRIADLAQGEPDAFEAQALSIAEERRSESLEPAYPLFSQAIAEIVRSAEFGGLTARGAQGKPGSIYRNIVVFDPWRDERWVNWLAPAAEPLLLDPM